MSLDPALFRAGKWFLRSGIQQPGGGVSRYYRTDLRQAEPVSTEITSYTLSVLLSLHAAGGEAEYLDRALSAARFLCAAWDGRAMPFELHPGSDGLLTYFFDCGIIVRGLLGAWRLTREQEFLDTAVSLGRAMAASFADGHGDYHPALRLPEHQPVERDPLRWSRAPGCYQLKSAMGWWDLWEATDAIEFRRSYEQVLDSSLRSYASFLPGHPERLKVVDRLHAFLYFLEGLLPRAAENRCSAALCHGIQRVAEILEETAPQFERSDVYAQLLRVRIYADWTGAASLDAAAARREAGILAGFQAASDDPRIDGGFYFGRQDGVWLPFVNPVSTAFAVQALGLWSHCQDGGRPAHSSLLI